MVKRGIRKIGLILGVNWRAILGVIAIIMMISLAVYAMVTHNSILVGISLFLFFVFAAIIIFFPSIYLKHVEIRTPGLLAITDFAERRNIKAMYGELEEVEKVLKKLDIKTCFICKEPISYKNLAFILPWEGSSVGICCDCVWKKEVLRNLLS